MGKFSFTCKIAAIKAERCRAGAALGHGAFHPSLPHFLGLQRQKNSSRDVPDTLSNPLMAGGSNWTVMFLPIQTIPGFSEYQNLSTHNRHIGVAFYFGSFKILLEREGTPQGCSFLKARCTAHGNSGPSGGRLGAKKSKSQTSVMQPSEQPPLAPLAPAAIPKALFPLDPGSWLPASLATGSLNAFISAPVPGQEVSYSCKNHRRPTGKRRNRTYTLS